MYQIEECEACQHGTRFPQGMYCFTLKRYISEDEAYPNPCGKFSFQQAKHKQCPKCKQNSLVTSCMNIDCDYED